VLPQERLKDREAVLRFQREMRAVGNLRHPNIVEAPDAGEADGMPYLVMEYVDGCDLGKLVGRMGPLPVAEACDVIRQAALGLEHAHEQGRVHRDVKPSNLMLSTEGQVKVLDLGLARLREDLPSAVGLSTGNRLMGTADYMAPEQAANTHAADIRADVYSLGCTLYALLAGHPPFAGPQYPSRAEKLVGHARDHAPLLDGLRPDVPEQLAALVARMLSKSPDQRPATPGEVAQALDAFAAGADLSKLLEAVRSGVRPDASIVGQLAPRAAAAAPSRRRNHWKRWTVMAAAAGLAILAGVITIVTDRGTLEINTLDEGVQVLVSRNGQKVTIVDTATGSTVTLHSGDYEVKLVGGKSGLSLDKDRITLRRGGIEVVKVIPPPPPPTSPTEPPRAIAPFDGQKAKEHQEAWAKYLGVSVEVTNAIGMKLVLIPPGEHVPSRDEKWTQFRVWLRRPLFCGKYEVTQAEFEKVMGTNPSFLKEVGPSGPVETVSRETAEDFCKTLSTWPEEQAAGRRYRLPTGVEWEFVCRAGTRTYYCFGDDKATLGDYAWYDGTSEKKTHPVGQKKPNAWGLYDMHGNVYEWCSGTNREIRGGAWSYKDHQCGSASHVFLRTFVPPRTYVGFRVLCELAKPSVPVTGTAQGSSGESARPATRVEEQ
jgi:hypothetical protein